MIKTIARHLSAALAITKVSAASAFLVVLISDPAVSQHVCNPDRYLCNTGTTQRYVLNEQETAVVRECHDARYEIFFTHPNQPNPPEWGSNSWWDAYHQWEDSWKAREKPLPRSVQECLFELTGNHPRTDPNAACVNDVISLCERLYANWPR